MARKSEHVRGRGILGMGVMLAVFHCLETVDELRERLKRCETGAAKKGAPSFRNQLGRRSGPGAVGLTLSRVLKTSISDNQVDGNRHVNLRSGCTYAGSVETVE